MVEWGVMREIHAAPLRPTDVLHAAFGLLSDFLMRTHATRPLDDHPSRRAAEERVSSYACA
jgi:hypothetical protein